MSAAYLSRKFSILSVVAMLFVVLIHSKSLSGTPANWNVFIQWFFTRAVSKWAVPFFFMTSGFWFYHSYKKAGSAILFYRKKIIALLIPYFLWSVIGAVLTLPLIVFNNLMTRRGLFERTFLEGGLCCQSFNQLLGITVHAPIGNAVLWYVHTLLCVFLFAPILWFMVKNLPNLLLVIGLVGVFLPDYVIPICAVHTNGIGWVLIGVWVSVSGLAGHKVHSEMSLIVAGVLLVAFSIVEAMCEVGWVELGTFWRGVNFRMIPPCGILFFWSLYDFLPQNYHVPEWFQWTFWIYCVHAIINSYFMSAVYFLCGKLDVVLIVTMFVTPFVGVVLSIISARLVKCKMPCLWRILAGGRG